MCYKILMNKYEPVMKVEFDDTRHRFIDVLDYYYVTFAPLMVYNDYLLNHSKEKLLESLNIWYGLRAIPDYRDGYEALMNDFDVQNGYELAVKDYSLSLTDQYWLCPEDEYGYTRWDDINYFFHDYNSRDFFDSTYGDELFDSLHINDVKSNRFRTPNNTLNGQLRKSWVKDNGIDWLIKGTSSLHNFDQVNEVMASLICKTLAVPYVEYKLKYISSKRHSVLATMCENFVDSDHEYITAFEVLSESENLYKNINDFSSYIKILEEHGIQNANEYVQKMFMLDFIVLNEDRHLGNFGIIRNVNTLEWERIAPVFDTGKSMNTNVTSSYWNFEENDVKCFTNGFISSKELMKLFSINISKEQITELKKIPAIYDSLLREYQEELKLFENQIDTLVKGLSRRIELLNEFLLEKGQLSDENEIDGPTNGLG